MAKQVAKAVAEAWQSKAFPVAEAEARLEKVLAFVGQPWEIPSDQVAQATEVGEALRAESPERVGAALRAFAATVDVAATIAHYPTVKQHGRLTIALPAKASMAQKALTSIDQDDFLTLISVAPDVSVEHLLLWLELGDENAKKQLLPRFAGVRGFSPSSGPVVSERIADLFLQFGSVEEELRSYIESGSKLAGIGARRLADRLGLGAVSPGHTFDVAGVEGPYFTYVGFAPMLEVAFRRDPALFYELLQKVVAVPAVGVWAAMSMTDGIPWDEDFEVRNPKQLVRVRRQGTLVFVAAGSPEKFPTISVSESKDAHAAAEDRLKKAEGELKAKRSAPQPTLPKATKKTSHLEMLRSALSRHDRAQVALLVRAGVDLAPVCEDPWDHPPLFDAVADPEAVRLLLAHGANAKAIDGNDSGILTWSANHTEPYALESFQLLLDAGAEVVEKTFHRAADSGNVGLLEVLAKNGHHAGPELIAVAEKKRHHGAVAFLSRQRR